MTPLRVIFLICVVISAYFADECKETPDASNDLNNFFKFGSQYSKVKSELCKNSNESTSSEKLVNECVIVKSKEDTSSLLWSKIAGSQSIDYNSSGQDRNSFLDHFLKPLDCYSEEGSVKFVVVEPFSYILSDIWNVDLHEHRPFSSLDPGIQFLYFKSMIENFNALHKLGFTAWNASPFNFVMSTTEVKTKLISASRYVFDQQEKQQFSSEKANLMQLLTDPTESKIDEYKRSTEAFFKSISTNSQAKQKNIEPYEENIKTQKALLNEIEHYVKSSTKKKYNIRSLGISFFLLVQPELGLNFAQQNPADNSIESIWGDKVTLKKLIDMIRKKEWIKKDGKDLNFCYTEYFIFTTCLIDIIEQMVHEDDSKIEESLELIAAKMDLIYLNNYEAIEGARNEYSRSTPQAEFKPLIDEDKERLLKEAKARLKKAEEDKKIAKTSRKIVL